MISGKTFHIPPVNTAPGSKVPGIRVWHIDATLQYLDSNRTYHNTTNPSTNLGRVTLLRDNTYSENENGYKLLQYVRNDESAETYLLTDQMNASNMFKKGERFFVKMPMQK